MGLFNSESDTDKVVNYARNFGGRELMPNECPTTVTADNGDVIVVNYAFDFDGRETFLGPLKDLAEKPDLGKLPCQEPKCGKDAPERLIHMAHGGDQDRYNVRLCREHSVAAHDRLRAQCREGD